MARGIPHNYGNYHKAPRSRGFTLIELLVSITIIALLSAFATTSFIASQTRARDSVRKAQVNTIATAVESFYSTQHRFPGKAPGTPSLTTPSAVGSCEIEYPAGFFVYTFFPFSDLGGTSCEKLPAQAGDSTHSAYDPAQYLPFPSWIPELGPYLASVPSDPRYHGQTASDTSYHEILEPTFTLNGTQTANLSQTIVYRHLDQGYAVYAHLETTTDQDAITSVADLSGPPTLPASLVTSGTGLKNIYMIRK